MVIMQNQKRMGLGITRSTFDGCLLMFLDKPDKWPDLINDNWKLSTHLCELSCLFFHFLRIIFLFHKNGQMSYKAKVKPPRLNGQRVGVYSTRSPHRPNALGLTLAKLERIAGTTTLLYLINSRSAVLNPANWIKMTFDYWK